MKIGIDIKEESRGEVKIITLSGRLDVNTSPGVQKQLQALMDKGEKRLVFDLSGLTYISSVGLGLLIIVAKKMQTIDGKLALATLNDHIHEIFKIAGFTRVFSIYPTRDEAVAYCAG